MNQEDGFSGPTQHLEQILDAVYRRGIEVGKHEQSFIPTSPGQIRYVMGIWNTPGEFKPILEETHTDLAVLASIEPIYPNAVICAMIPSLEGAEVTQVAFYQESPIKCWVVEIRAQENKVIPVTVGDDGEKDDKIQDTD